MKTFFYLACALCLLMQTGIALALPPCPESGYYHNCFGTRTYVIEAKVSDTWAALDKEIEFAKKEKSSDEITQSSTSIQKFNKYVGEFKDDMRDGYGVFTEGSTEYKGNWKNDKKNGDGLFITTDGAFVFAGQFKDDKRFGYGQLLLSNGDIYVGEFADRASIIFAYKSYNYIVQEWIDRGIDGLGVMRYADGRMSLGEWKFGMPHGSFVEYGSDKKVFNSGIYSRGKLRESKNIDAEVFSDITILKPCQEVDVKKWTNCSGEVSTSDEAEVSSYRGEFQGGNFYGQGEYIYEIKGDNPVSGSYRGEFKNRRFDGLGIHKYNDGRLQIGEWHDGKPVQLFLDVIADQNDEITIFHISR